MSNASAGTSISPFSWLAEKLFGRANSARTAGQRHHSGLDDLADTEGLQHAQQRLDLAAIAGGLDGQRLDVEPAPREQRRDPREHTGLVFDQHRQGVRFRLHQACPSLSSSNNGRMPRAAWISSLLVPAATIGHTCASAPTMKSITTGRSLIARAWLITSTTSSSRSHRNPTQPSASANFTKSGIRCEWVARSVCE